MYILQPHPGCNESESMRVRPASCVSTSPPGDTLKTGNSCWRPFWAPMSFYTEVPNSDPFLRPSSAPPPPGPFTCPCSTTETGTTTRAHTCLSCSSRGRIPQRQLLLVQFPSHFYCFPTFQALSWLNSEAEISQTLCSIQTNYLLCLPRSVLWGRGVLAALSPSLILHVVDSIFH